MQNIEDFLTRPDQLETIFRGQDINWDVLRIPCWSSQNTALLSFIPPCINHWCSVRQKISAFYIQQNEQKEKNVLKMNKTIVLNEI